MEIVSKFPNHTSIDGSAHSIHRNPSLLQWSTLTLFGQLWALQFNCIYLRPNNVLWTEGDRSPHAACNKTLHCGPNAEDKIVLVSLRTIKLNHQKQQDRHQLAIAYELFSGTIILSSKNQLSDLLCHYMASHQRKSCKYHRWLMQLNTSSLDADAPKLRPYLQAWTATADCSLNTTRTSCTFSGV